MLLYMQAYLNSLVALVTQHFGKAPIRISKIQVRLYEWKNSHKHYFDFVLVNDP